jgi:glycerophosphoryl diester phosphodiesterase
MRHALLRLIVELDREGHERLGEQRRQGEAGCHDNHHWAQWDPGQLSLRQEWRPTPILCEMGSVTIAIAHRGDPLNERENTLPAFESAVQQGADMVEIDLRRTRDGVIVVLHDPTLERLWGVDHAVADLDASDVEHIGSASQRIPTFRQVLQNVPLPLMVDFTRREVVEGALDEVRAADAIARSLFVTGNVAALRMLRSLAPEARIGLTWVERELPAPSLLEELGAEFWNPMFQLVTPDRVAAMHDLGLKVSTWTVDRRRHMERVARAGVDAIVSNRIADLRAFLA